VAADRDDEDGPVETPPEDATCAEPDHADRAALAVCPRCGAYACLACWHPSVRRCHACLMRDPAAAAPPIPWEEPSRNVVSRFFGTIATALRPTATAPAFARGDAAAAWPFFALSFLPAALLVGVIPFTHTLAFGSGLAVAMVAGTSGAALAGDVVRAAGIGTLVCTVQLLAMAMPYVSLARAYASKGYEAAPARVLLYRGFLIPIAFLLRDGTAWALPASEHVGEFAQIVALIPLVLLFLSLSSTARMASGAGPFAALGTALVPFVVMLFAEPLLLQALRPLLPDAELTRQALQAAGGP
jgi:hypothetical protein